MIDVRPEQSVIMLRVVTVLLTAFQPNLSSLLAAGKQT